MMTRSLSWLLVPAFLGAGPAGRPAPRPGPEGQVTSVALQSSGGTARFTVGFRGAASVRDFPLSDPDRLILDISGVTKGAFDEYDHTRRGIVTDVRVTQFDSATVRVVLQFDRMPTYTIDNRNSGQVTVVFADAPYAAWQTGAAQEPVASALTTPAASTAVTPAPASSPAQYSQPFDPATFRSTRQQAQGMDFIFDDTPIRDVLNAFARASGRSIIPGSKVEGNVSFTITNARWEDAFQAFLSAQGLAASVMPGNIIRVDAPGELAKLDSVERLSTQVVRLNYSKAADMAKNLTGYLTKVRGHVEADSTLNAVIITDTWTKLPGIVDFVKSLDVRPPTVSIEAKLIYVDRTDLEQLGVKYDIGNSTQFFNKLIQRIDPLTGQPYNPNTNVVNLGGNAVSAISNADALISGSALDLVFSTAIGGFSLTSFLSALERVELTDVEATPHVSVLSNHPANILSGEETPVRVIDASSFGQVNQAPRANVQFKTTGIQLTATPSVTADRHIVMDLQVERSSIQPLAAADLGFNIPTQKSSSRLLVSDGEVAVMSGMVVTTVTRNRQSVPLLGSLPFLGKLFSFTTDQENRKDLIILVTPRIMDDPEDH